MIQRIQTVFLFIVAVASICLFFFPLAGIYSDTHTYKFFIYELRNMVPGEASIFNRNAVLPLAALDVITGGVALWALFSYKNRIMQLRLVRVAIFADIIMLALVFFVYANIIERTLHVSPDYMGEAGIYFPLVMLIFLILSNRYIIKDERMIRSIDRLR